jgi:hypothetical protein
MGFDPAIPYLHKYISKLMKLASDNERIITLRDELPSLVDSLTHDLASNQHAEPKLTPVRFAPPPLAPDIAPKGMYLHHRARCWLTIGVADAW